MDSYSIDHEMPGEPTRERSAPLSVASSMLAVSYWIHDDCHSASSMTMCAGSPSTRTRSGTAWSVCPSASRRVPITALNPPVASIEAIVLRFEGLHVAELAAHPDRFGVIIHGSPSSVIP
jgi:hypothetical protein